MLTTMGSFLCSILRYAVVHCLQRNSLHQSQFPGQATLLKDKKVLCRCFLSRMGDCRIMTWKTPPLALTFQLVVASDQFRVCKRSKNKQMIWICENNNFAQLCKLQQINRITKIDCTLCQNGQNWGI